MPTSGFDTYYGDTPVQNLETNQRQWYHPIVDRIFRQNSVYNGLVPYQQNLGNVRAKTMTITSVYGINANFDPIGLRDLWLPASHIDSRAVDVTFERHGGKVAYMRYDDIITYWLEGGESARSAIRSILQGALGDQMVDVTDMLIRNAFLGGDFKMFAGTATGFGGLTGADEFDLAVAKEVWLGMAHRNLPLAVNPEMADSNMGSVLCITSPGAIFDIQSNSEFLEAHTYADPGIKLKYEVGQYKNVRFLATPKAVLYNCGEIIARAPLDGAHAPEDGAPDPASTKVDGVYKTGQPSAQHYIQLDTLTTGSMSDFEVNDIVSIHTDVTSDFGVTNGADYRDGSKVDRRIVGIDAGNLRLVLDRPLMQSFATGYVTLATHIHTAIFLGGPGGVVAGVGSAPSLHTPPPVDDLEMMYRFSWDAYLGYNVAAPEVFETYYFTAPVRLKGAAKTQAATP